MTKIGGCRNRRCTSNLSQFNTSYSSLLSEITTVRAVSFDANSTSGSSFLSNHDSLNEQENIGTDINRQSMDSVIESRSELSTSSSMFLRSKSRGQSTNLSSIVCSDECSSSHSQIVFENLPLSTLPSASVTASASHGEGDEDDVWGQFVEYEVSCDDYSLHSNRRHRSQEELKSINSLHHCSYLHNPYSLPSSPVRRSCSSGISSKHGKNMLQEKRNYPTWKVNEVEENEDSKSILSLRRTLLKLHM